MVSKVWYYQKKKPINIDDKRKKFLKKNKNAQPVLLESKKIATTWWGIAWCKNLESYADYESRLSRGRSYVRGGNIFHLGIREGFIEASVQGSSLYDVDITIDKLSDVKWEKIVKECENKITSLNELLEGKFPKDLEKLFLSSDYGLFPSPKEIHFSCDCPDWASMCKHVAATLYGVAYHLDRDPSLFFTLRGVDINQLISKTIDDTVDKLLVKANNASKRIMDDVDISELFKL